MMKKLCFLSFFAAMPLVGSAQTLKCTTSIEHERGAIEWEGKWHTLQGGKATFVVKVEGLLEADSLDAEHGLEFSNTEKLSYTGDAKNGFFITKTYNYVSNDPEQIEFALSFYRGAEKEVVIRNYNDTADSTIVVWDKKSELVELKTNSQPIFVYNPPKVGLGKMEKDYCTSDRAIEDLTFAGGNETGWHFQIDELPASNVAPSVLSKPSAGIPVWQTNVIKVVNLAPDGKTEWYSWASNDIQTYFYDTPIVKIAEISEKETNFYKNTGESEWGVSVSGGNPDNWEYAWTGGQQPASTSVYRPFIKDVTKVEIAKEVSVTVVNKEGDHELYRETLPVASINIYPEISYKKSSPDVSVYTGEEVRFIQNDSQGGYPGGWEYTWDADDTKVTNSELKDNPNVTTKYTVTAINKYNGKEWDRYNVVYTATVYPRPSVDVDTKVTTKNVGGAVIATPELKSGIDYDSRNLTDATYQLVLGDEVELIPFVHDGVETKWNYKITDGSNVLANNQATKFKPEQPGEYTIKISLENGVGTVEHPYLGTITRKFVVYDIPKIAKDNPEQVYVYSGEANSSYKLKVDGGHKEGWTFENLSLDIPSDITARSVEKRQCNVQYECEGYLRYTDTLPYDLIVMPKPTVSSLTFKLKDKDINVVKDITYYDLSKNTGKDIIIDCFDGDEIDIAYTIDGGYADSENKGWYFSGFSGLMSDVLISNPDHANGGGTDLHVASTSGVDNFTTKKFTVKFQNKPDTSVEAPSSIWLDEPYNVTVRSWHQPVWHENYTDSISSAKWTAGDRVDVYAGGFDENNVNFKTEHSYGYNGEQGGWSYIWSDEASVLSNSIDAYTYVPKCPSDKNYIDKTFTLHVVNRIGDNYSFDTTHRYNARVWHKAIIPTTFTINDRENIGRNLDTELSMRQGNTIEYATEDIKFGYTGSTNTYRYNWDGLQNSSYLKSSGSESVSMSVSSNEMNTQTKEIGLKVVNYGPYNRVWDGTPHTSKTFTVYAKPKTPDNLVKKGTGASGTMICTTSISDQDLEGREYYLVFGYENASGRHDLKSSRQSNPGQVRWSEGFSSSEVNNSSNKFYVYALWKYKNGAEVTSGLRYVNGSDESWDTSTYSGKTRAVISDETTGVSNIYESAQSSLRYFTLDGKHVQSSSNMPSGIYLKETFEDGVRVIKKIMIK